MLRRLFGLESGLGKDGKKLKKQAERFSLEFIKINAVIPPDHELLVHYIARDELIFKCSVDLGESQATTVHILYHPIKSRGTTEEFDTPVRIIEKGKLSDTRFLYKTQFVNEDRALKNFFQYLKDVESTQLAELVDYHDRRTHYRLNRRLPVVCRDFNGYKGLTRNISCGGLQVTCGGGIKKGEVIEMRLELDDYHADPIVLIGEVCWVVEDDVDGVRVGLRFLELTDEQREMLKSYISSIRKREHRD